MAYPFELPKLWYDYAALEPHIDARTMEIHHTKHHQAYTDKLNGALENHEAFHGYSDEQLLRGIHGLPEEIRAAVRNHGGGYQNHNLFWHVIAPGGGSPSQELAGALTSTFGSMGMCLVTSMSRYRGGSGDIIEMTSEMSLNVKLEMAPKSILKKAP